MTQCEAIELAKSLTHGDWTCDESTVKFEEPIIESTGNSSVDFILGVNLFGTPRVFWVARRGLETMWCSNRID